ncbi:MAG: prepilin-type N-terminal cleavage/methylation domain-containing protein [Acidobacteria bacterium]|nr:prepilin-type N-terminal cleavage/methylation domain-containing protein [Acidobacteriota bacterium]
MQKRQAFSLIELMVVIAIIAILAAIALPLYQDFTCKTKANEPLKALADIKGTFGGDMSGEDLDDPTNDWSSGTAIGNTLSVALPSAGRWDYSGVATTNDLVITISYAASRPACLQGFVFDYHINRTSNDGLRFRVPASSNSKYVRTTELTGGIK